jgi:mRNA interferase HigB
MHIISRRALRDFAIIHANAEAPLDTWYRIAKAAAWKSLVEIQETWPSSEAVGELTIFNIKGNTYRLVARINYRSGTIFIRAVLTHAEYDKGAWKRL